MSKPTGNPPGRPPREALHNQEKRGRGRPRKDEIVTKPVTVHHDPRIKEENKLKYAEQTIKNAEKIYRKYERSYPNPLNIEDKKLCSDAKAVWEYLFSCRETLTPNKIFHSGDEVLFAFEAYLRWIKGKHFMQSYKDEEGERRLLPIVPSQSNFAEWLGLTQGAVRNAVERYDVRTEYESMLADVLSEGIMIGAYQQSAGIFSLKNLCNWADKVEDKVTTEKRMSVEEAENLMLQLGYSRPLLEDGKNT